MWTTEHPISPCALFFVPQMVPVVLALNPHDANRSVGNCFPLEDEAAGSEFVALLLYYTRVKPTHQQFTS